MRVTDSARKRIDWINQHHADTVRLAVHGGGCAGFRYEFDLDQRRDDDLIVDDILIDPASLVLLHNAVVDFVADLHGEYFRVEVPDATSSCGCGKSFSIS